MHAGLSSASIILGSLATSGTPSFLYGLFLPGVILWIIIAVFVAVNDWKLPEKK
jgi:prolipoprotein diacylglyceryltransferase